MHYSFDFDYTLADSSQGTVECAQHALAKLDLPKVSSERIKATIGLSIDKTFTELIDITHTPELLILFEKYFLERAETAVLQHIKFYPDTLKVLETLKKQEHYVSIVSTKHRSRIIQSLRRDGLLQHVDFVVGGDEVTQNKPDPQGLLQAIAAAQVEHSQTIYVGDSESDGECAARAGVRFVAVTTGKTSRKRLEKWRPEAVLTSLSELVKMNCS